MKEESFCSAWTILLQYTWTWTRVVGCQLWVCKLLEIWEFVEGGIWEGEGTLVYIDSTHKAAISSQGTDLRTLAILCSQ